MAVTYCTADQVAQFLQRAVFDGSSTPTKTIVEEIINRKEDYIDQETSHAWRTTTITNEYVENPFFERGEGVRFDLAHRTLTTFTSGTDKIEIWDGANWIEYVANKTGGRGEDYFVDEENGVVFIRDRFSYAPKGARFTYRYGESTVAKQIEEACIKLVAIDILSQEHQVANFPDDGATNRQTFGERIEQWKKDVDEILDSMKELTVLKY